MLTQSVKRDWHQPAAVLQAQANGVSAASNTGTTYTLTLPATRSTSGTFTDTYYFFNTVPNVTPIDLTSPYQSFTIRWTGLESNVDVVTVALTSGTPEGVAGKLRCEELSSSFTMRAGSGESTGTFTSKSEDTSSDPSYLPNRLFLDTNGEQPIFTSGGSLTITISP
jgi:hypothetical protein